MHRGNEPVVKLLWLTILFVMIAEVLIFVPSVANTRVRWLEDRLNTAAAAAVVIEGINEMDLPRIIQNDTLDGDRNQGHCLRKDGACSE
jgi:hypothetical protein